MKIAWLVTCPNCKNYWHVIIEANPCYDACPDCKTEFRATLLIELEKV